MPSVPGMQPGAPAQGKPKPGEVPGAGEQECWFYKDAVGSVSSHHFSFICVKVMCAIIALHDSSAEDIRPDI